MLICRFCGRECKNANSLRNHERLCKENPNKQEQRGGGSRKGCIPWNKGLKGVCKHNENTKEKLRKRNEIINETRSEEDKQLIRDKISNTVTEKVKNGTWHTSLAKHMHINYNGVDLHGSWEVEYVKYLDFNNIKWCRNTDSFSYIFEGKQRKYTPDFYLYETDEYIEIKGYKTLKDISKWDQFPSHRKLTILMKKELLDLGISIK